MNKKLFAMVMGLAMLFVANTALAGMSSGTATYSVTILSGCTIDTSMASADFGTFAVGDPTFGPFPAGSIAITCYPGVNYMWGADAGLWWAMGVVGSRTMSNGSGISWISYDLIHPVSGAPQFGDAGLTVADPGYLPTNSYLCAPDGGTSSFTATGNPEIYPLSALANIQEATQAGTYSDTVTFTVVYP